MPALKNSTGLRNRYRVTNKTRLKVIKGDIDAESILVEEDEERARVVSTAGVDAEDANVRLLFTADCRRCCGRRRPPLLRWTRVVF